MGSSDECGQYPLLPLGPQSDTVPVLSPLTFKAGEYHLSTHLPFFITPLVLAPVKGHRPYALRMTDYYETHKQQSMPLLHYQRP